MPSLRPLSHSVATAAAMSDFSRTDEVSAPQATARRARRVRTDGWLLVGLVALSWFGLVVMYSASGRDLGAVVDQALKVGLGFAALIALAHLRPELFRRWTPALFGVGIVLLVWVLFDGTSVKGSQRWIDWPGLPRFQPSELMKVAVPLGLAWLISRHTLPPRFRDVAVALAIIGLPAFLIAQQPDLGTAVVVAAGGIGVIFLAGVRWRWIIAATPLGLAALPALWLVMTDYQRGRVLTLFDPERDPQGAGWNIIQSKTALGSGGFFGKGLGNGTQSQLDFLPERETDFIIAVVGEELGLLGVMVVVLLYLALVARCLYMATEAQDNFGRLFIGGFTLVFAISAFVNIAMVSGLLPVVGLPLPLVSMGGTSTLVVLGAFGIVMAIHSAGQQTRTRPPSRMPS